MNNITHKSPSPIAWQWQAGCCQCEQGRETIIAIRGKSEGECIRNGSCGGIAGHQKYLNVIPDCHPLPVEGASISHDIQGLDILISVQVGNGLQNRCGSEAMHNCLHRGADHL